MGIGVTFVHLSKWRKLDINNRDGECFVSVLFCDSVSSKVSPCLLVTMVTRLECCGILVVGAVVGSQQESWADDSCATQFLNKELSRTLAQLRGGEYDSLARHNFFRPE